MNGIPWPSEVWTPIGEWLNVNLYTALHSEIMLQWVLPLLAWVFVATMFFSGFMFIWVSIRGARYTGNEQAAIAEAHLRMHLNREFEKKFYDNVDKEARRGIATGVCSTDLTGRQPR